MTIMTQKAPRTFLHSLRLHAMLAAISILPAMAATIPAELPAPDANPPSKDKPVKVYILSGQSNCLGFGRVEGAIPFYESVYLSADPAVTPSKMPVGNSAILPHGIYQSADGDAPKGAIAKVYEGAYDPKADYAQMKPVKMEPVALGTVSAELPTLSGQSTVVVEGTLEVPVNGNFQVHAGFEDSSLCIAQIDGKEVYRKTTAGKPKITEIHLKKGQRHPIRITYLKNGSAALWLEKTDMKGMGDLRWVTEESGKFKSLVTEDGEWVERPDVILCDAYMGKGKSDPLSAKAVGPTFGPELGFGWVMGEFHDEPVIVMKADIGNRSLGWDILPPGTESWEHEGTAYPGYGLKLDDNGKLVKPKAGEWYAGKQYDDYTASIHAVLDNFGEKYPQYKDQGFEVAGFVWWQGHKDGPNPGHNARYEQNLANLIKAWRKEFKAPDATWAIATVGFHGKDMVDHYVKIAEAQMAVADPQKHPEFVGTVKTIDTRPFWRDAGVSPKNQDYHYNHNAETYMLTGDALGRAMVELKGGQVEYPSGELDTSVDFIPTMQAITDEELAILKPALLPIMMDQIIPEYAASTLGTPRYRRYGQPIEMVLKNKAPEKNHKESYVVKSQLDKLIEYYELASIDEYAWKSWGPEMQTAGWQYFSFDPKEPAPKKNGALVRYRDVALPQGMENWYAVDFDAAKAGWKTGKAPFGQNNGELKAVRQNCGVDYCGCDITPNTMWENEVLLMRQTFRVPAFDPSHRYRLVVGGAGHAWSGEGMALYVNGNLVSEMDSGYYKSGGDARGVFLFEDLQKEMAGKEVTIAVKSFLRMSGHKSSPAPPVGHLSAWIQAAKLPPTAIELMASLEKE